MRLCRTLWLPAQSELRSWANNIHIIDTFRIRFYQDKPMSCLISERNVFMRSIVFSFKKSALAGRGIRRITLSDLRYFFKRYGIRALFAAILLCGLVTGSICAQNSDESLLNSLDFLFTTNLDARLAQNAAGTFCACFASDFIFLFSVFLFGLTPWGVFVMPLAVLFKGFGTGITAGYLFLSEGLAGVGFYLLVLLPGTFLFCIALVLFSAKSFAFSKNMFGFTFGKHLPPKPMRSGLLVLCSHFMSSLIMTFCASLIDAALWTLFAGAFNF